MFLMYCTMCRNAFDVGMQGAIGIHSLKQEILVAPEAFAANDIFATSKAMFTKSACTTSWLNKLEGIKQQKYQAPSSRLILNEVKMHSLVGLFSFQSFCRWRISSIMCHCTCCICRRRGYQFVGMFFFHTSKSSRANSTVIFIPIGDHQQYMLRLYRDSTLLCTKIAEDVLIAILHAGPWRGPYLHWPTKTHEGSKPTHVCTVTVAKRVEQTSFLSSRPVHHLQCMAYNKESAYGQEPKDST